MIEEVKNMIRPNFQYYVSPSGIFYGDEEQDIIKLEETINGKLPDTLINIFGIEKAQQLFSLGDKYLMAAIIENCIGQDAITNLENYYNTILNNDRDNPDVGITYDFSRVSLSSKLKGKMGMFNDKDLLSYFIDTAYTGRDFSRVEANMGIKLGFTMRNVFGKVKNIFQRVGQGKLEAGNEQKNSGNIIGTTGKEQETPEESIIATEKEQETPADTRKETEQQDLANSNGKETYQRLQVLISHLSRYEVLGFVKGQYTKIIENALEKGEISEVQAEDLITKLTQIVHEKKGVSNGNSTLKNTAIQEAYKYEQEPEKSFNERMKPNPLFTQFTTMIGEATSAEELSAWNELIKDYSFDGFISNDNSSQLYSQIEKRKTALSQEIQEQSLSQENEEQTLSQGNDR